MPLRRNVGGRLARRGLPRRIGLIACAFIVWQFIGLGVLRALGLHQALALRHARGLACHQSLLSCPHFRAPLAECTDIFSE